MKTNDQHTYVALDLGAGSGRAMLGRFDGETLRLDEVHRFEHATLSQAKGLFWNARGIFDEITEGLGKAAQAVEGPLDGVAVDTWGVDYALLDGDYTLLENPHHYRDPRTDGRMAELFEIVPRERVFDLTGIQFLPFNTLYQLFAQVQLRDPALAASRHLLMMPDLFNYWLTGRPGAERTIASTSQCYNPRTGTWAYDLLQSLNIPSDIFPEPCSSGVVLGSLRDELAAPIGLRGTPVHLVGSHDTASAVAAVPLQGRGEAYLSSGTWSLLGVERKTPVIDERSLQYNFTNELGVDQTVRLLKNITGLWIIQELRRTWSEQGESLDYDTLEAMARDATPFAHFIDVDDPIFLPPGDMESRIRAYCRRTGQPEPVNRSAILRTAYESLVFKCRWVLELLEELTSDPIDTLHVVGGGTRSACLNQWTASATGRTVRIGPTEATAVGNILMQMQATGALSSLEEGRQVVLRSFPSATFHPEQSPQWAAAYAHFCRITGLHRTPPQQKKETP